MLFHILIKENFLFLKVMCIPTKINSVQLPGKTQSSNWVRIIFLQRLLFTSKNTFIIVIVIYVMFWFLCTSGGKLVYTIFWNVYPNVNCRKELRKIARHFYLFWFCNNYILVSLISDSLMNKMNNGHILKVTRNKRLRSFSDDL